MGIRQEFTMGQEDLRNVLVGFMRWADGSTNDQESLHEVTRLANEYLARFGVQPEAATERASLGQCVFCDRRVEVAAPFYRALLRGDWCLCCQRCAIEQPSAVPACTSDRLVGMAAPPDPYDDEIPF